MTTRTFQSYQGQVNVKDYGAVGDDSTNDTTAIQNAINACFETPHTSVYVSTSNKILYFPAGAYKITSPLSILGVAGGIIKGEGKTNTTIHNSAGGNVFNIDGFAYGTIKDLQLTTSSTGVCLNLDATGTYITTQSNLIESCSFQSGAHGCIVGDSGIQASENTFLNCNWANNTTAGLKIDNANALNNQVIGGNLQSCATAILVQQGSAPVVCGVGFQLSTVCDIKINNAANEGYSITGCRTESVNFIEVAGFLDPTLGPYINVSGCCQIGSTVGIFLDTNAGATVSNCFSEAGTVSFNSNPGLIQSSRISGTTYPSGGDRTIVGALATSQSVDGAPGKIQTAVTSNSFWNETHCFFGNVSSGPAIGFAKSRHATAGSHTIVADNDVLGTLGFHGSNGTTFKEAAYIGCVVDGTPGSGSDMPTRFAISLSKDGTASPVDVLIMKNDGGMILGGNAISPGGGNIQMGTGTHAFADLPASPAVGMIAYVSNANTATHGATISGTGANQVLAWYNGTNWTVVGS